MNSGYTQVYTGNGKGKTTASIGLALRAAGAGLKIYIAQFLKMGKYSEIKALEKFAENIEIEQFGTGKFIIGKPSAEDINLAEKGLKRAREKAQSGKFDIIILEEANPAVTCGIITQQQLLDFIDSKPLNIELIITGRDASQKVIEKADLVTEMKEIKHYYKQGVQARTGIEK